MAPANLVVEPLFVEAVYRFVIALRAELARVGLAESIDDKRSPVSAIQETLDTSNDLVRVTYPDYIRSCWYFDKLHVHAFQVYVTVLPLHGAQASAANLGRAAAAMGLSMTDLDDMQVRIGEISLTRRLVRPDELAQMVVANAVGQVCTPFPFSVVLADSDENRLQNT
jgi:hypothetical protein